MKFDGISNDRLIEFYNKNPQSAYELLYKIIKVENPKLINSYNKVFKKIANLDDNMLDDSIMEIIKSSFIDYNGNIKNLTIDKINKKIDEGIKYNYTKYEGIISFASYKQYFWNMLLSKSEVEELEKKKLTINGKVLNDKDAIYYALMGIEVSLVDDLSNEAEYSASQLSAIRETIDRIYSCVKDGMYSEAKAILVSLQLVLDRDVEFLSTLNEILINEESLTKYVDIDGIKGNDLPSKGWVK